MKSALFTTTRNKMAVLFLKRHWIKQWENLVKCRNI